MQMMKHNWLLVADGEPSSKQQLLEIAKNKRVMVLDGAYDHAKAAGLPIDILLGDLDTISEKSVNQAKSEGVEIVKTPDQNYTDFEKGIMHLDTLHAISITVGSAMGKRLQHTVGHLAALKKFHDVSRKIIILTQAESIFYAQDQTITLNEKIGDGLALLGFPNARVNSTGLRYEMMEYDVSLGEKNSLSNSFSLNKVMLEIIGSVLVIHEREACVKNDL